MKKTQCGVSSITLRCKKASIVVPRLWHDHFCVLLLLASPANTIRGETRLHRECSWWIENGRAQKVLSHRYAWWFSFPPSCEKGALPGWHIPVEGVYEDSLLPGYFVRFTTAVVSFVKRFSCLVEISKTAHLLAFSSVHYTVSKNIKSKKTATKRCRGGQKAAYPYYAQNIACLCPNRNKPRKKTMPLEIRPQKPPSTHGSPGAN